MECVQDDNSHEGDDMTIRKQALARRSKRFISEDVHRALFPDHPPKPRTLAELKQAIRPDVQQRQARHCKFDRAERT
jgi:hypothetical protein